MSNTFAPICRTYASAQSATAVFARDATALQGLIPAFYRNFYEIDVRRWLQWYDGYVDGVHGPNSGIISTNVAKNLVDRAIETVFAGGVMFGNADKPTLLDETGASIALSVISDNWAQEAGFEKMLKRACRYATAGGTGLLKLNQSANGKLWLDAYRTDRFFPVLDTTGRVESVKAILTIYNGVGDKGAAFALVEERYYTSTLLDNRVPVRRFSVYRAADTSSQTVLSQRVTWRSLPHAMKNYLRENYASIRIDEEQLLPFTSLGCYAFRYTDGCDRYNGVELGESMLHSIMQYLLSYDFYFSAFNTDMYLGRGRVIAKKPMKNPGANGQNQNAGLDSFLYDQVPTYTTEEQKPVPIQFDLRAAEWREIRNNLLESMAFSLGLSVSTLASFLNDSSNRTAREISAEEHETTRFVEERRAQFADPANDCLRDVCLYCGLQDRITVRWSLAGQTNVDNLSQRVVSEYQGGARSLQSTVQALNPDMDEHQVQEELKRIEEDQHKKSASIFGDIGGATELI